MAIRHYTLVLTTAGPVHIGNGEKYEKKDYFSIDKDNVAVLDVPRFISELTSEELDEYCRYLETDSRNSLQDYLDAHPRLKAIARKCAKYTEPATLARARRGSFQYLPVAQCVKEPDGRPYVPGSSVKGMLRTAILTYLLQKDPDTYAPLFDSALTTAKSGQRRDLTKACRSIERKAFWRVRMADGEDPADFMRYVSVADSEPLLTSDLAFVKRYDKFAKTDSGQHKLKMGDISRDGGYYEGNELNIYRECIRPGVRIELALDIDDRIDAYLGGITLDATGIAALLESSDELYSRCFLDHFKLDGVSGAGDDGSAGPDDGRCRYIYQGGPLAGMRCRNRSVGDTGYCNTHKEHAVPAGKKVACYLGGGVGFGSKTVVAAMFGDDRERVRETARILYEQFTTWLDMSKHGRLDSEIRRMGFDAQHRRAIYNRRNGRLDKAKVDHRHWRDSELGVSPHTVKLGILGGKKYLMGKCTLEIEENR